MTASLVDNTFSQTKCYTSTKGDILVPSGRTLAVLSGGAITMDEASSATLTHGTITLDVDSYIDLRGTMAVGSAGWINLEATGLLKIAGTAITATAAQLNAAGSGSPGLVAANGDTLAVTAALHAGKTVAIGKTTGTICTLPAATGTGNRYEFVISIAATSNANIIKVANSTDVMAGSMCIQADTDVDGTLKVWYAGATADTMTFAGDATTGGNKGNRITCVDYLSGFWSCTVYSASGGGSEVTIFSATV